MPDQIKVEAAKIAEELIYTAQETARQMLLRTNLDVSQLPLICNKITGIEQHISEIKIIVKDQYSDHETRLRFLEKTVWRWLGMVSVALAALAYFFKS